MEFEDLSLHTLSLIIKNLTIEEVEELSSLNPELDQKISSIDEFWRQKYLEKFGYEPVLETTYRDAYMNRFLPFQIDNLVIRIGYEYDDFEYLVNGEYYSDNLGWEEEPGDEYVPIDSFMIDPRASKIIGIFFYPGDTRPMLYQEKNGQLIELTPRGRFIEEIASVYVLEVPDSIAKIIPEEPLKTFPLKEPDPNILKQINEIEYEELEGDLDKILNIRLIPVLIEFGSDPEQPPLYLKTYLWPDEYRILEDEIRTYNDWIENFIESGKAPESSYDKDYYESTKIMIFQTNPGYKRVFKEDIVKNWRLDEHFDYGFRLINLDKEPEDEEDEGILSMYHEGYLGWLSPDDLVRTLTEPHGYYEFNMGYRTLPLTQKLIDEDRFKEPRPRVLKAPSPQRLPSPPLSPQRLPSPPLSP